jgi:hypothetical protein
MMGDCPACGDERFHEKGAQAICDNAECSGGGMFFRCGYCGEASFAAPEPMTCFNVACRMHGVRREECPTCRRVARVTRFDKQFCLNKSCSGNDELVPCDSCAKKSFLQDPGCCIDKDCHGCLARMTLCDRCDRVSLDEHGSCQNCDVESGTCFVLIGEHSNGGESTPFWRSCFTTLGRAMVHAERIIRPEWENAEHAPGKGWKFEHGRWERRTGYCGYTTLAVHEVPLDEGWPRCRHEMTDMVFVDENGEPLDLMRRDEARSLETRCEYCGEVLRRVPWNQ